MPSEKLKTSSLNMTAPWTNPAPLADIPDGETNLLHRTAWSDVNNPLRVEFKPWYDTPPPVSGSERVDIFLGDESNVIETKTWALPMKDSDHFIEISANKLPEGQHELGFIMTNFEYVSDVSSLYTITLDKTPPLLATDSTLIFPPEVSTPNSITASYLADPANNDQVLATLPDYSDKKVGDVITWYWGSSDTDIEVVDTLTLEIDDITGVLPPLTFTGNMIRNRGDGQRYAHYQIEDRAGNLSLASERMELQVKADPTPRDLPWPLILNADSVAQNQTLNPMVPLNYYVVEVPQTAVVNPGEKLWIQWGVPGQVGAGRFDVPQSANPLRFEISKQSVAAFIGKNLPVYYGIEGINDTSLETNLNVSDIEKKYYPPIQCEGVSGVGMSYKNIKDDGAALTLKSWMLMTTDQVVRIKVSGVLADGITAVEKHLPEHSVIEADLTAGIGANRTIRVEKDFFNELKRGENFMIHVSVSFDQGATWPITDNFPAADITLVD